MARKVKKLPKKKPVHFNIETNQKDWAKVIETTERQPQARLVDIGSITYVEILSKEKHSKSPMEINKG